MQLRVLENRYVELRSMADGSLLRMATFNNVEHIVVPIVTAVGDNVWWPANAPTPEFVPASVLAAHAFSRNNRPVVMGHPKSGGEYVSANDPEILEEYGFGHMFASSFANGRIVVEAWLDPVKAEQVGPAAVSVCERLRAGEQVEVSEGDYVVTKVEKGQFNGKQYGAVWVSAVSDHLAMLHEGDVGACSNEMGCGGPRVAVLRASLDGSFGAAKAATSIDPDGKPTMRISALSQARRPTFTGTESVRWSKPSLADYVKYLDNSSEPPKTVGQCLTELKEKIAAHTLLGDPSASSFADLSSFPVVNPANDKLNERALRAVLVGRGSSADVSDTALASAQEIARRLLNSEFSVSISASEGTNTMKNGETKNNLFKRMLASIRSAVSNNDLRWNLYKALCEIQPGVAFVEDEDVDTKIVTYCVIIRYGDYYDSEMEYHYFQRGFDYDADANITLAANATEVEFVTGWEPVADATTATTIPEITAAAACGCANEKGDKTMKPTVSQAQKDFVNRLIVSSVSPFEESDRGMLESMTEDKLKSLVDAYKEPEKVVEKAVAGPAVETPAVTASAASASAVSPAPGQRVLTEDEYSALKTAADAFQRQQQARRGHLVTSLKAACGNAFTEADLNALDTHTLEKLAISHRIDTPASADFSLRGVPSSSLSLSEEDKLKAHKPTDTWAIALAEKNKRTGRVADDGKTN